MEHGRPPDLLRPPILNPTSPYLGGPEPTPMDADLSLTGNGGATGNSQGTSDKQTVMVKLDCGLLEELGISEENVGKLLSELLRGYIRGTQTQEQTASQRACDASRNDEVSAQYARDFPSLATRQEKQKLEIPLFARGSDEPDSMKFFIRRTFQGRRSTSSRGQTPVCEPAGVHYSREDKCGKTTRSTANTDNSSEADL
ncbi:hypothetical protein ISCGN_012083 [Ixodes scapularis]